MTSMKKIGRWLNQAEGTTAIEFSLLAVPFVFFVVGILELSFMFAAGTVLQGAVNDAARLIRTGQIQQAEGADPEAMFKSELCRIAGLFLNCDDIQYEVRTLATFSDADMEPELDEDGNMTEPSFEPGGVSDIVMIRVHYLYPLMTPGIGGFFADYPNNRKLLLSTVVLETEPYDFEDES